jgi:hypothetical protein
MDEESAAEIDMTVSRCGFFDGIGNCSAIPMRQKTPLADEVIDTGEKNEV